MHKMPKFRDAKITFSSCSNMYSNYNPYIDGFTDIDRTPFTYLIEHLPTGLKYYGVRYAKKCSPSDMGTKYTSSSKLVWALLKNADPKDIKFEIRKVFRDVLSAGNWERKVNRRLTVKSSMYLNIKSYIDGSSKLSIRTKTIAICNRKDNTELRIPENMSISLFSGYELGRLNPAIKKGTQKRIYNRITGEEFNIGIDDDIPDGFVRGSQYRSIKNITTKKFKSHNKFDPIPEGWSDPSIDRESNAGTTFIVNNGKNLKSIKIGSQIPEGWTKGIIESGNKGRNAYYNPNTNHVIYIKSSVTIPDGYIAGNPNMIGLPSPHKGKVTSYNPVTDKLTMTLEENIPIGNTRDIPKHKINVTEKGSKWYHNFKEEIMIYPNQEIPNMFIPGRLTEKVKRQNTLTSD